MSEILTLPVISGGNLESYIRAANSFPVLSREEEISLTKKMQENGDINAAHQLVLSHLRTVVMIARGYLGYGLPHADLIQEGNIGLMKAVRRFDPERGVRLISFAIHWIKAEIHEFIMRNWRLVKIATTKPQRKLFFNLRSMKEGLDTMNQAEVATMAEQLGVKAEEVVEMETRFSGRDISLEPLTDSDEEDFSPIAYLTDGSDPSRELEKEQLERLTHAKLKDSLDSLDERSRRIIEARWLREDKAATLHELAKELGVSAERVRQIEAKAMKKMRAEIAI
ncbi:RNA polymerase, sigma 32 subunit, RpoH [Nitrosomonas eutropha]|uniref:RNA polymerase sigma factor RpoH n=1 Tax=Nitrosomonas TaxID=914 RepID=UPI000896C2E8|nr:MULTISPECIES: RNA polymerase sigma factor RpoH [Nitrosomonas]MXS81105.1 RNA polymerase sigma factor RpoH [Nitrosomonas sp. GH22]SDW84798.1 RNA polymerase, sigma 32 subunit, RpoH [Nitrosomonas eutropha]